LVGRSARDGVPVGAPEAFAMRVLCGNEYNGMGWNLLFDDVLRASVFYDQRSVDYAHDDVDEPIFAP